MLCLPHIFLRSQPTVFIPLSLHTWGHFRIEDIQHVSVVDMGKREEPQVIWGGVVISPPPLVIFKTRG